MPHPSIWYAHCLLMRSDMGDTGRVEEIIAQALDLQELHEGDPHRGNFSWFLEEEVVTDLNACQFVLEALVHMLLRVRDRLSDELRARITEACASRMTKLSGWTCTGRTRTTTLWARQIAFSVANC